MAMRREDGVWVVANSSLPETSRQTQSARESEGQSDGQGQGQGQSQAQGNRADEEGSGSHMGSTTHQTDNADSSSATTGTSVRGRNRGPTASGRTATTMATGRAAVSHTAAYNEGTAGHRTRSNNAATAAASATDPARGTQGPRASAQELQQPSLSQLHDGGRADAEVRNAPLEREASDQPEAAAVSAEEVPQRPLRVRPPEKPPQRLPLQSAKIGKQPLFIAPLATEDGVVILDKTRTSACVRGLGGGWIICGSVIVSLRVDALQ